MSPDPADQKVWAWPQRWEYHVEQISIADKWSAKRQREELERVTARLNQLGSEGWELVEYDAVPLYGGFTTTLKGYAYLSFWKRPITE